MHPLLQKIEELRAKHEMLQRRDQRLRCARAFHEQECYEVQQQIEQDFVDYTKPPVASVSTWSGWQSRGRQVCLGEKARKINNESLFHITQTKEAR